MISIYEDYIEMPESLSVEVMSQLHAEILNEIGSDSDAAELYEELIKAATKYMYFRSNWHLWDRQEKLSKDASRTSSHDSVIVKFNQLSRYLKMQGKQADWRDKLGYEEENPNFRKRIGDFACYIVFVNSLVAR